MALITRDDVRKIAKISCIEIHEDELDVLAAELEEVLVYASSLKKIAEESSYVPELPHTINVVREDCAQPSDARSIVLQAPEHEENLFVVPVIVK